MSSSSRNPQIYVGGLSRKVRREDVERAFDKYGKIRDISFKSRYAFIVSSNIILAYCGYFYRNLMIIMQPGMQWIRWMEGLSRETKYQ
jgi:RNA recognition motif-containing protein